ncbi:MAG: GNAT family N-acetyltransferase [Acidimicrobiia bacterium]|nr:GNAT family N-acetyltransferase [Acidimicrobiia bacterium]
MEQVDIHIRPFEEPDLWIMDRDATDPEFGGPFEWVGFRSSHDYRQRWQEDQLLGKSPYNLCVALQENDTAVGWVNWRETDRAGPGSWEIGVLIVPDMRNRGIGTIAQSLLVDYLFAHTTTHRIWAGTEADNIAEQRALERCGFRQEGLLRGHHFRNGEWQDSYVYAITRPENADRSRP